MTKTGWKSRERDAADFFCGMGRNPLSGENSGHTRSDTLHPVLFVEVKSPKRSALYNLLLETRELARKEGKIPVLAVSQDRHPGFLIACHSSEFELIAAILGELRALKQKGLIPDSLRELSVSERAAVTGLYLGVRDKCLTKFAKSPRTHTPRRPRRSTSTRTSGTGRFKLRAARDQTARPSAL